MFFFWTSYIQDFAEWSYQTNQLQHSASILFFAKFLCHLSAGYISPITELSCASHRILAHGVFSHATMRFQGTRLLRDPSNLVTYCRRLALEEKNMEMLCWFPSLSQYLLKGKHRKQSQDIQMLSPTERILSLVATEKLSTDVLVVGPKFLRNSVIFFWFVKDESLLGF